MIKRLSLSLFLFLQITSSSAQQLAVARDTITVIENGTVLKMPWANGINYANLSNIDLNFDGKKDLVVYDRLNHINTGRFRCFLKSGNSGQITYKADPDLSYGFPEVYNWAVFYDYNCDGKEDLFCSTNSGIKVYRNNCTVSNPVNFILEKPMLYSNYNPGGNPVMGNIYSSPVGVPGFSDIDNDGDLDILTFSSQGVFIEYHKNMSKEVFGTCDSLMFEYTDACWGKMSESSCGIDLNQCLPKAFRGKTLTLDNNRTLHAGSCLTCFDSDSDGDKDLILGDIFCNKIQYAHNGGTSAAAYMTDTTILYPNYPLKHNTLQVKINNFPCGYYVDVDDDGKKDLVATPSAFGSENCRSVWYYKNASLTNTVNFQFVKKNLLQDEMIEVGQNAFPMLFDYNADGKKDLLIGTYGYYLNDTLKSQLTLYKNTGSTSQPSYSLVTRNYAGLATYTLNHLMPTSGDIDNDGDVDLLVGTSSGQIHWLENTAGFGTTCNFSIVHFNSYSITTLSSEAAPQLFDIDQDGKLDLLIGMKNGRIAYYRNVGTASNASFSLVTNQFGNVDVRDNISIFGIDGYAVPYFYTDATGIKLLVGSITGNVFYYTVPSNLSLPFNLVNAHVNNISEGAQSAVCYEDINGDAKRDLIIGNAGGGLSFYSSTSPYVSLNELNSSFFEDHVFLYPNPAQQELSIQLNGFESEHAKIQISDLLGQIVLSESMSNNLQTIDLSTIKDGFYIARISFISEDQKYQVTKKFLKQK